MSVGRTARALWAVCGILMGAFLALSRGEAAIEHLDGVVAVVNDDVITGSDLAAEMRLVEQQLRQQKVQAPAEEVLRRQVLERLISKRLQLELAATRGIQVDDEAVNQAIRTIAQQNNLTVAQFRQVLERDGFDFGEFRDDLRSEITLHRLRQRMVDNHVTVTEREVDDFLASQRRGVGTGDEYHLAHILIAIPEGASAQQIEAARKKAEEVLQRLHGGANFGQTAIAVSEGQQALKGGDLGWRKTGELPTMFVDAVAHLHEGETSDLIRSPSGFHIIKLLEKRGTGRHEVRQAHIRHILLREAGGVSEEQVRRRLDQLRQRILAGEDFAALARAHSQDNSSASHGGDLGWVDPSGLPNPFAEVLSHLSEGQVSEPFKTTYGWHIVQLVGRREQDDSKTFARDQAQQQLRARKIEEETQSWLRQLRDEAYVEYRLEKP